MAKLPYTWTICPTEPAPKQYTASCKEILLALMNGGDLVIDQRRNEMWNHEHSYIESSLVQKSGGKMEIVIESRKVKGMLQQMLFPVCDKAKLFAAIVATPDGNIPHETLGHIANLGYEIIMKEDA